MRRLAALVLACGCGAAPVAVRPPPPAPGLLFPVPGAARCSRGFVPGERHFALDVPAAEGTPVHASAAGDVVRASAHPAYGLAVILVHRGLPRLTYTLYAHLASIAVERGARVEAGEAIGAVGRTGNASGPHLHFEVLEADAPLPLRATGPIGLAGEAHRIDPAAVVDAPAGCRSTLAAR
jgi:murein DD-endopeptidase MepM/ murein hydrolase activator NlpD